MDFSDRMKRLKRNRLEFSGLLKSDKNQLCAVCLKIDFASIFDLEKRDRQPLCTLSKALKNNHCPLCQLLVQVAASRATRDRHCHDHHLLDAMQRTLNRNDTAAPKVECAIRWTAREFDLRDRVQASRSRSQTATFSFRLARNGEWQHVAALVIQSGHCGLGLQSIREPIAEKFHSSLLRRWLDTSDGCQMKFGFRKDQTSSLETLIQVGSFRLLEVASGRIILPERPVQYVALSYVLGRRKTERHAPSSGLHASSSNERTRDRQVEAFNMDALPATVRDAAALVRQIGQQYLWVDTLCIDQSNPEDVQSNILNMSAVYENAYLTIVAADGEDANAGLPRLTTPMPAEQATHFRSAGRQYSLLPEKTPIDQKMQEDDIKWTKRAWTFQERSLCPTCVIFTNDEVYFQCSYFEAREAYRVVNVDQEGHVMDWRPELHPSTPVDSDRLRVEPNLHDPQGRLSNHEPLDIRDMRSLILEFTSRDFTYPGDRLDAFTGILNRFHPENCSPGTRQALSGMPEAMFLSLLSFDNDWPYRKRDNLTRLRFDKRGSRELPSWSWIGWQGMISCGIYEDVAGTCEVRNDENIICNTTSTPWGVEPELREPSRPFCVTLHLWTQSIRCYLRPKLHENDSEEFDIHVTEPGYHQQQQQQQQVPFTSLFPNWLIYLHSVSPEYEARHHLIVLHDKTRLHYYPAFLLLVQGDPTRAERIGSARIEPDQRHFGYPAKPSDEARSGIREVLKSVSVDRYFRLT